LVFPQWSTLLHLMAFHCLFVSLCWLRLSQLLPLMLGSDVMLLTVIFGSLSLSL
jgi:hypothetical protein